MFRALLTAIAIGAFSCLPAKAGEIEGRIVSLDAVGRQITLETGETFDFSSAVSMEALSVDQTVRVAFAIGTVDVQFVDILQEAPVLDDDGTSPEIEDVN